MEMLLPTSKHIIMYYHLYDILLGSWDSSVGIATGYRLGDWGGFKSW
jgi:hypothetical protein